MTPTLDDYWRAVDFFVEAMAGLGDDVEGVVLWGSLARGQVIPGKSDVLDIVVVFRDGLLDDLDGYRRAVRAMAGGCAEAARGDLPFSHPPEFRDERELSNEEGLYAGTLASPLTSQILAGADVRERMFSGDEALRVARCGMLALRRRFLHPLAAFLHAEDLPAADQQALFARMGMVSKGMPVLVCAALGRAVDELTAVAEMRRLLPDFDFGVLDEIVAIRRGERSWGGPGELKDLLRRLFDLLEPLHQAILNSEAAAWRGLVAPPGNP
jgi:predicted nucleotidyltransferase